MDQNRDWDRQPYLLVHESVPVSFDISNTLLDWSHINIARVIDALHILQAPDADGTELNKQYRAHGVLMDIWHNDVNQITCLRPAVTGAMSSSYRLLLPPGQCATEAELDLCGFWCDRATAKNFFISGDIHYAPWTSGIYVFLMPRRIVSELGTICPETNRFRLNQNTKIIPVVTNMYRMFGAIQSGYDAEAIESGLYRIAFAQQPNGNSNKLTMIFRTYVNIPMLYRHLENGDTIPSRALLVTHLSKQLESTLNSLRFHGGHSVIDRFKTFVNHPMKSSPREKSAVMTLLKSNGAPLSFKPYDYQFDNVAHIVRVEQAVDDGDWSVKGRKLWNPVRPIHLGYKDMGFLCAEKCFVPLPEQQNSDDEEVVHHFRGGMICDGAGLGKTVSVMLAAALRGPRLDAATGSSIFSGYGGTLIICPSQVVGQFQEEILRITPKARILILSTKRQHEKLTYRMLLESEYVICSDSFIVNQSHKRLLVPFNLNASDGYGAARKELGFQRNDAVSLGNKTCPLLQMVTWTRLIVDEAHLHVQRPSERTVFLSQLNAKYVWLVTGTPFQERPQTAMTEFRRYMQLLNRKRSERFVPQYELSRSRVCEFSLSEDAESNMDDSFFKTDMFENILGSLFVLHTRDSVAEEIQLPPVVRHTVFVDFTPTETALYNHVRSMNSSIAVLAETCVHPNIQTAIANLRVCKSLDEVKEAMTSGIRDELDLTVTREAAERATVDLYRKRLVDMGQEAYVLSKEAETLDLEEGEVEEDHDMMEIDADEVSQTTPLIQQQQQQNSAHVDTQHQRIMRRFLIELKLLRKSQRHIDNLQRSLNFFSTVADIKEGELCTICLCSIEGDETGNSSPMFTTCGHRFCSLCITSWIQSHGNCPICRKELTSRDVLLVASNPKSSNLAPDVLFQDHRAQFGTKIAFLLKYIMERKDQKLIVYSQYDSVLSKTTKLLRGLGIPFATCYGNIAARQKGIRDFKGDVNIILLSTQASNTGLNLTQASEVIFLDPVFRNANERIRIESQCLARLLRITQRSSQVRLTKFVVRGTIEYDEWEREQQHIS